MPNITDCGVSRIIISGDRFGKDRGKSSHISSRGSEEGEEDEEGTREEETYMRCAFIVAIHFFSNKKEENANDEETNGN